MKCKYCGVVGTPRTQRGLLPPKGWRWSLDLKTGKNTYFCPECSISLQNRGRRMASNGQTRAK